MIIVKQKMEIQQPNCIDENGHIVLQPIIDIAKQLECPYIALIGEKRIGKTYGCVKYALQDYYKTGAPFFYARRYDKTFTESICGKLVDVHRQEIINLSGGKHNAGELKGKYYELCRRSFTANGILKRDAREQIAYCRSLNNVESETADDKGNISCVIYDEFLTRGRELDDEFNRLMILHANATGKRVEENRFIPLFLLGNTVSRESKLADCFGIRLRDISRGVNVITNSKGVVRLVLYYSPETCKSTKAAETYYDRFENDHIKMIAHGDWTLGQYNIMQDKHYNIDGVRILFSHHGTAVLATVGLYGMQPIVCITKPSDTYDILVTSGIRKTAINYIPPSIVQIVLMGRMVCETSLIGEDFRDICKHLNGGDRIVNYIG